ncbi:hypothetical protein A2U01_0030524, partial [Trifolium medium]|nr:hypothetical protein [Trifolium medium]
HCFASFFAMRVKAAQKGLAFPITESTANSRPYLKRVTNVLDRSNESVDFSSSLSAINTYIALLRGRFYPLKEHLNSRSWYGLCFPPWMNQPS